MISSPSPNSACEIVPTIMSGVMLPKLAREYRVDGPYSIPSYCGRDGVLAAVLIEFRGSGRRCGGAVIVKRDATWSDADFEGIRRPEIVSRVVTRLWKVIDDAHEEIKHRLVSVAHRRGPDVGAHWSDGDWRCWATQNDDLPRKRLIVAENGDSTYSEAFNGPERIYYDDIAMRFFGGSRDGKVLPVPREYVDACVFELEVLRSRAQAYLDNMQTHGVDYSHLTREQYLIRAVMDNSGRTYRCAVAAGTHGPVTVAEFESACLASARWWSDPSA